MMAASARRFTADVVRGRSQGGIDLSPDLVAVLGSWSWEPPVVLGMLAASALYALGWVRLSQRRRRPAHLAAWRAWCFAVGIGAIGLALLSPIGVFSQLFFFAHMTQHLLLVVAAAPLLLLGAPLLPMLWALPRGLRLGIGRLFAPGSLLQRLFGALTHPFVAGPLFIGMLALWHLPSFYDEAQGRTLVHDLEHLCFLGTALLFWWPVIHPAGGRRRLSYGAAIPYLFFAMLEGNLIGALLTFADHPLYATYQRVPRLWGISLMQDQQMAGLIMWVPGGLAYFIPIFAVLAMLLKEEERAARAAAAEAEAAPHGTSARAVPADRVPGGPGAALKTGGCRSGGAAADDGSMGEPSERRRAGGADRPAR